MIVFTVRNSSGCFTQHGDTHLRFTTSHVDTVGGVLKTECLYSAKLTLLQGLKLHFYTLSSNILFACVARVLSLHIPAVCPSCTCLF